MNNMRLYPSQKVSTPDGQGKFVCTIFSTPLRAKVIVDGVKRVYYKSELQPVHNLRFAMTTGERLRNELARRDAALAEAVDEIAHLQELVERRGLERERVQDEW
jgi:hypothetical protein